MPACVARPTVYPPAAFAHRVATSDVAIYWNCTRSEFGQLQFDGVAQNIGGSEIRYLGLELNAVDAKENFGLSAVAAPLDILLYTNQLSPFHLQLPIRGDEARFDLFYQYRLSSRFGAFAGLEDRRFMARDVCSDTQHRVN